ncbi:aromatic ring-hydroxylating dioxygenase subunit alpha [Novosphingobium flavum]|uniref:Aromatic ring-hydroxylating dioxygenase subunit alpha n=1 Tax=Novosphingobium aerophilum TaxID=2839843 RepID=A0A7X1F6D2_9SPHN|nr:aromatic ring-hydroxylating dioxygenase subunit alpha [Novosphingobium aerophilum]MBC2651173.1 aromatic ring-hydroxylating dioxygenase subunit alpha [Novosphingobium aerophilum]MBC2660730.1 aromatic ring-hydroxylating dioxygenase subunit alpha [Novosphingobium aerophilum]
MQYARNAWYVAAWSEDLPASAPLACELLGEPLVLWRRADGTPVAFEDRCVHRLAPLSLGRCEGDLLRCMYHGIRFAADGVVSSIPGQDLIPAQARVRTYPVIERHDWLWVWPGDAALADPALIPPAVGLSDPDWILGHGQLDYAAEAALISDNLCDFSHLSYVHAQSFGAGPEFADNLPRVSPLPRGVRFERWLPVPADSPRNPHGEPVEAWQTYDYLLPGVLLMWSANYPQGTAEQLGGDAPAMSDALGGLSFTSQAVTPLGDGRARYFFSWGPHRRDGDAAKRDAMMAMAHQAFAEDKAMIEAQHARIATSRNPRIMPTAHDRGVTLYNRLVERLVAREITELETAT